MILGIFRAFATIKLVGLVRIRAAHPVCPHMVLPPPGSWRNRITRFIVKMMIFYIEVQHPYILKYSWYIQARPLIQGSSSRTFVTFLLETSVSFMKCTWKYPNSIIKGSIRPSKKMFICENLGGQQKSTRQAGNSFFPNFQTIHTNYVFKGTKEISGRLKSAKLICMLCCQSLSTSFCSRVLRQSGPTSIATHQII